VIFITMRQTHIITQVIHKTASTNENKLLVSCERQVCTKIRQ